MLKIVTVSMLLLGTGVAVATMLPRGTPQAEQCAETLLGKTAACIRPAAQRSQLKLDTQPGRLTSGADIPIADAWDAI